MDEHKGIKDSYSAEQIRLHYSAGQMAAIGNSYTPSIILDLRTGAVTLYSDRRMGGADTDDAISLRDLWWDAVCVFEGPESGFVDLVLGGKLTREGKEYCAEMEIEQSVRALMDFAIPQTTAINELKGVMVAAIRTALCITDALIPRFLR